MPARDDFGAATHPDLDDRWDHPEKGEEFLNLQAFTDAGLELSSSFMGMELPEEHPAMEAYWGDGAGDDGFSLWIPEAPEGDGWRLISVHDTEEGPVALWVRELRHD